MAVQRYQYKQKTYILIPSSVNRDLALFLIFLGLVGAVPGYYILNKLFLHQAHWDWRLGGFVGLGLVLVGLFLLVFTRKSFRLGQGELRLRDGLFRRPLNYRWHENPRIRMRSVEEEHDGKPAEVFEVHLVDGRYNYLLDRRPGEQMESRTLAEILAKAIGCPIVEKSRETGDLVLQAEELDLSYSERAARYPSLLGPPPDPAVPPAVKTRQEGDALVLAWNSFNRNLLSEVLVAFGLIVFMEFLPFKSGAEGAPPRSFIDLMAANNDYSPLFVQAGILVVLLLILGGLRHEFWLRPDKVTWRQLMWGIPTRQVVMPTAHLEQISVRESSRGNFLQLISDRVIITRRLGDSHTAGWLAARIRHHYGPAGE